MKTPTAPTSAQANEIVQTKFMEMFGANGPAVKELLVRAGALSDPEIKALAEHWRPSMSFLHAQTIAWKVAQKFRLERPAELVYNAAYESVSHQNPDWQAAGNVIAHAVLGKALSGKLAPALADTLSEAWDATIAPLPAASASLTKVRVRARSEAE